MNIFFETERVLARKFEPEDAAHLYENHAEAKVKKWFPNESYADIDEAKAAIQFFIDCVEKNHLPFVLAIQLKTFGSGIRKIYTLCNEAKVAVTYTNEETAFTLEFSRNDRNIPPNSGEINGETNGRISEAELMLLSVLKKSPSMTNTDLAVASGKSERTISRLLAALKNKKLIQRIGSNKTGYWKVV